MGRKYSKVKPGINDLATLLPEVLTEWNYSRNIVNPDEVMPGSDYIKVWWVCDKGHEWEATPNARFQNSNIRKCPYCTGRKVLPGYNDLATTHPVLAEQWSAQNDESVSNVSKGSNKKFYWVCPNRHVFLASPKDRYSDGTCQRCVLEKKTVFVLFPELENSWDYTQNMVDPNSISYSSTYLASWVCEKGHKWKTYVYARTSKKGSNCPQCSSGAHSSKHEKEIIAFLNSLNIELTTNTRSIIAPYELDMFIPSRGVAIEFNGLYWHSEANGKGKTYHYDKWRACKEQGVQLIQVWEDDWNRNPELVKRMLAHKLGVSLEPKVYARKLEIRELGKTVTDEFLNEYHIQGSVNGGIRLGLILGGDIEKLVAVMVLKTEPGTNGKTLNLLRYATSQPVPGGFSKILTQVERTYTPESIITFSDNTVSDGGLYKNNGFIPVKELKPDYMYVFQGQRKHKFGYRLKRFRNDPALQYVEGLTEKELAQLNGLPRVWDAGKTKWVKSLKV